MIFNMVGPISDTSVQSVGTDREVAAAETEPPQEAETKARVLLCSTRVFHH